MLNHCKNCQRPHLTLLHTEENPIPKQDTTSPMATDITLNVTSELATLHTSFQANILLITCQVMVETLQGVVKAQALLDTGPFSGLIAPSAAIHSEC